MFDKYFKAGGLHVALLACLVSHIRAEPLISSSFGIAGDNATYDYVIVGGGNAGLTVATRLVQQNAGTVAVVEAGSFYEITNGNISTVPATGAYFSGKGVDDWQSLIDWGYMTTPQVGAYNNTLHYARGKTLGGSTARNFMVYHRGTKGAYQQWADAVGDQSYAWENFFPFFRKSINFTEPNMNLRLANSTPHYNATDTGDQIGPLSLTFSHSVLAFATWAVEGFAQMGLPIINNFVSGSLLGQSYALSTINADTMHRDSSETSFLREGLEDPALTVYILSVAQRVLFDENKRATGVLVESDDIDPYVLTARKEVILSAGSIGSPQLLMISGVGPAETLSSLDIPIISDLPGVGQGMQDHIFTGIAHRVDAPTLTALQDLKFAAEQAVLYNEHATGMYANTNTEVLAFEKIPEYLRGSWSEETNTTLAAYPKDWPEIEYISIPSYLGDQSNSRAGSPRDGYQYATISFALVAPQSRGYVTIESADVNVPPIVNPNYLTARADIDIVVGAFKRGREFFKTEALAGHSIGDEYFPGNNVTTDEQIEDWARKSFNAMWHATSTAAMGKLDNPLTVLDTKARVIGVEGLRVVDASAFPFLPPGHPMSTVYAFAEKLACDISGNC